MNIYDMIIKYKLQLLLSCVSFYIAHLLQQKTLYTLASYGNVAREFVWQYIMIWSNFQ